MAESEQPQRQLALQKVYLKDASLEVPKAPAVYQKAWKPAVDVNLSTATTALEQAGYYEVAIKVTVTAKLEEEAAFIVEIEQAGLFLLSGFAENDLPQVLNTHCPQALFPYAREAISDLVQRGGFQQLLLQPVNFDALYREHLERSQGGAQATVQ